MAPKPKPIDELFFSKVRMTSECWVWTAGLTHGGYGKFALWREGKGKTYQAHRFAYEQIVGPIPEGLQIDHLCRNRKCVRPDHMEPVTGRTNVLRGDTVTARNFRKTHCSRGHPFSGDNLIIPPSGQRCCRTCKREYNQRWMKQYYSDNRDRLNQQRRKRRRVKSAI